VASIYRLAFDENLIVINPCAGIARPKVLRSCSVATCSPCWSTPPS